MKLAFVAIIIYTGCILSEAYQRYQKQGRGGIPSGRAFKRAIPKKNNTNNDRDDDSIDINPHLVNLVQEFQEDLWPKELGAQPGDSWFRHLRRLPNEPAHRKADPTIKWHPVYCRTLKISWKMVRVIRKGNSNSVSLVKDRQSGKEMILKVYSNPVEFINEIGFLSVADHPLVVRPICHLRIIEKLGPKDGEGAAGTKRDPEFSHPAILLEHIPGMNSHEYAACCAEEADLIRITAQLLVVNEYINWLGYLNGDIKPSNVMIHEGTKDICVIDFGFTTRIEHAQKGRGTPATTSPEVAYRHPGTMHEGSQWWSVAVTVGMLFGARLNTLDAEQRADEAGDENPEENVQKYYIVPPAIPESDSSHSLHNEQEKHFDGTSTDASYRSSNVPKGKTRIVHYVPIGLRGDHFERHLTPLGFSPQLRHFLYHFFSLEADERIFNTRRLLRILYGHQLLKDINWSTMPSPLMNPQMFDAASSQRQGSSRKFKSWSEDRTRFTPIVQREDEAEDEYRVDL